ncbi:MAG TPA: nitrate/nitrite transporter [Planctomycetota bacterium]|jgi:NNP family nitrate/nitrite transporter-like MFS transporter|nr:nitrate/nitrite transporter [Planctomycetota bacterium]
MKMNGFLRSGHPATLAMSFLYFDVSFMVWVLIGVLSVYMAADFAPSSSQKGLLVALPILGGSLARLPMGFLVDRIGAKKTGVVGQLIVMIPLFWAWRAGNSLSEMMSLGVLLGVAGGSFAVALPLASRWYPPEHQGLAMGIAGAGNSGTVLSALFAPRLAEHFGWHQVFGLALIPVGMTLLLFILLAKESPQRPPPKPFSAYLALLKKRETLWFCLLYGFTFGGFVGLASSLVLIFHDQYGLAKVSAGTLTALCVFSGSFMRPVGGFLADRLGGMRVLGSVLFAASILLGAVALKPTLVAGTILLFLVMACLGVGNGSVFQLVPQRFQREIGVATGIIGSAGGLAGFLLPSLLGVLKQATGSYGAGFFCLSLAGAYGVTLLSLLKNSQGIPRNEEALVEANARG